MKTILFFLLAMIASAVGALAANVGRLRCEYRENPLGMDRLTPRLGWVLEAGGPQSQVRGLRQTSYQILVASSAELLEHDRGDLWDSGTVASDQSLQVAYAGKPLESRMRCWWKVRVWSTAIGQAEPEAGPWSSAASWSMGLLKPEDWQARWIGSDKGDVSRDVRRLPARYLRREFSVDKKVVSATAFVSGLGFFDLYLNGTKVSDQIMNPALSDYRKAAYYVTFDITDQVQHGRNALGVILGNGRYLAPRVSAVPTVDYGFPKLLLQTEIRYQDGSIQRIVSDESWKLTATGPILANNEFDGEEYDARLEMPGWCQPAFDDSKWTSAQAVDPPGGVLESQIIEPMRVTEVLKPVAISQPKPGVWVVDFGRNFYGALRLTARAPRGTELRLTSAYSVVPDGTLKTADNRGALATDVYIFKGEGEESWCPQFKGQGMRRVQLTGFPGTPTPDQFEGRVMHTDVEQAGAFACSNDLVNKIHLALRWGMRMFLRSAPLDPDRDERQPWMGDPAKDAESEAFNFNVAAFYTKWLDDVHRAQRPDGTLPDVSMNYEWGHGVEWPSVFTIIPDWYLDFYADPAVMTSHYAAMKRWVLTMGRIHQQADGTLGNTSYGDWCDAYTMDGRCDDNGRTPRNLVSTAYHYHNLRIMARAAGILRLTADEQQFLALAEQVKAAFHRKFFDPATGSYQGGTQCSYVLPLAFGMVPPDLRQAVSDHLVHDILVTHQGHLSVGLIGMQWLMQVLTDIGRPDVAWTLVTQTTRPSWGYMIGKGATTIWERWDCDTRDPGMNSEALLIQTGNLDAWFYQTLAGINYDPAHPGVKHILIQPHCLGDLRRVECWHDSGYGRIVSNWRRDGAQLALDITIPPNTTATVQLPASSEDQVRESGQPAAQAVGVTFLKLEHGIAHYEVAAGCYRFSTVLDAPQALPLPNPHPAAGASPD